MSKINWIKVDSVNYFSNTISQNSISLKDQDSVLVKVYFSTKNNKLTSLKQLRNPILTQYFKISELKEKYIPKSVQMEYSSNSQYFVKMILIGVNSYELSFKKDLSDTELSYLKNYFKRKFTLKKFDYKTYLEKLQIDEELRNRTKTNIKFPSFTTLEITTVLEVKYKKLPNKIKKLLNSLSYNLSNHKGTGQLIYFIET